MSDPMPRSAYWILVIASAVVLLVAGNAAASGNLLQRVGIADKKKKPVPYKVNVSNSGRAVLKVTGARPGKAGAARVTISNVGSKPIKKVLLTQDRVSTGGIGPALQLQVFDTTTKKCLYPRPKLKKVKPGKKPPAEPKTCGSWQPFKGGKKLAKLQVPSKKGAMWARKEQHRIEVRWRLDPSSPNVDQGRTATFRLLWRMMG